MLSESPNMLAGKKIAINLNSIHLHDWVPALLPQISDGSSCGFGLSKFDSTQPHSNQYVLLDQAIQQIHETEPDAHVWFLGQTQLQSPNVSNPLRQRLYHFRNDWYCLCTLTKCRISTIQLPVRWEERTD